VAGVVKLPAPVTGITGRSRKTWKALSVTASAESVRSILRAVVDARNGAFYKLWLEATKRRTSTLPSIGYGLIGVADSSDVIVSVGVSLHRDDEVQVHWGLGVRCSAFAFDVSAQIEVERSDRGEVEEVFQEGHSTAELSEAAHLIGRLAEVVTAQREWLIDSPGNREPTDL